MADTMIERIRIALEAYRLEPASIGEAIAVLTAMRPPTEAMIKCAEDRYDQFQPKPPVLADVVWQDMIDAALAEQL